MSKIDENVVKKISDEVFKLLSNNTTSIDNSFLNMGDAKFAISIKVELEASKSGVAYVVKMSFPSGAKVEDFAEGIVDDPQMSFLEKEGK